MEQNKRLKTEKCRLETGNNQVKRHSLTQLKLPNKGSGAEFSDKSSTPKTPTPTRTVDRLLRNCDAIGLFEELKHVNPFDETFRKAVENKDVTFLSSLKGLTPEDELNTPQYPSLLKDKSAAILDKNKEIDKHQEEKPRKYRKIKSNTASKVIRPILPKPSSTKAKLKAFILKDDIFPEKTEILESIKTKKSPCNKASPKPTDSNREAAKRYRERVKVLQQQLEEDNLKLRRENSELIKENAALKKQLLLMTKNVQNIPVIIQQIPKILVNKPEETLLAPTTPIYTIINSTENAQNNEDKKKP